MTEKRLNEGFPLTRSSRLIELAAAVPLGDEAAMVTLLGGGQ